MKAFDFFHFTEDDIRVLKNKSNIEQNTKLIDMRYRNFAKLHHPDRNGGSKKQFLELQMYYGTLKAVLNGDTSQKDINDFVSNTIKALDIR